MMYVDDDYNPDNTGYDSTNSSTLGGYWMLLDNNFDFV